MRDPDVTDSKRARFDATLKPGLRTNHAESSQANVEEDDATGAPPEAPEPPQPALPDHP